MAGNGSSDGDGGNGGGKTTGQNDGGGGNVAQAGQGDGGAKVTPPADSTKSGMSADTG